MRTTLLVICGFSAGVIFTLLLWAPQCSPGEDLSSSETLEPASFAARRVTRSNFQAVQLGMSYNEVVAILGPPSRTIYEHVGGVLPSAAYSWDGPYGYRSNRSYVQITFEYGKVVSKRQ
ncbi:MAG: hypothetical protein AB7N91_11120 [Candidatus Tectimicrobiota bacterium]